LIAESVKMIARKASIALFQHMNCCLVVNRHFCKSNNKPLLKPLPDTQEFMDIINLGQI